MKKNKLLATILSNVCMTFALLVLFPSVTKASAAAISAQWSTYPSTSTIAFTYSGASTANKSWIGIYKTGTVPGKTPALAWRYVSSNSGTMNFSPSDFSTCADSPQKGLPLARGKYQAYLFNNSGYSYSCTPYTFWIDGDEPVYSFDVLSDFHVNSSNTYNANNKLTAALTDLLKYSPSSKDIIVNGDAVDDTQRYSILKKSITSVKESSDNGYLPNMTFNIGNHELYYTPSQKTTNTYESKLKNFITGINNITLGKNHAYTYNSYSSSTPYFQFAKGGCHFIFLAPDNYPQNSERACISSTQVTWAYNTVYHIAKYTPNEPIFVFIHEPFQNTVSGSSSQNMDNDSTLRWYLNKFPTVTVFTSHTHSDFYSSTWMYQEAKSSTNSGIGITMFNTSSVGDIWKNGQDYGSKADSQGLHVDVYNDSIVVRARDFANKKWIKEYKVDLTAKRKSLANSNIG